MADSKPIVLYYSRGGRTEKLARLIAGEMHTEIIRVDPVRRYSARFFETLSRVMIERAGKEKVPAVTPVPDLSLFNPVFVGSPVWMGDLPPFLEEYLSGCALSGKIVIPFTTSFGGGPGRSLKTIRRCAAGADVMLPFEDGVIRGGDYRKWRFKVRQVIHSLENLNRSSGQALS